MWLLAATAAISAQDWAVGTFRVSFGASQTLSIFDAAEQLVWQSLPSESFVAAAKSNDKVADPMTRSPTHRRREWLLDNQAEG